MVVSGSGTRLEELAHHLFDVVTRFCLCVPRSRRRLGDLKEIEFLTLSLLHQREKLIVGDIQRQLGVLPAQMSRIIRALENRERPLIACRINPRDKRKIDVCLTAAGEKALVDYQAVRIGRLTELLRHLSEEDQDDLSRLLDKLHNRLDRSPTP